MARYSADVLVIFTDTAELAQQRPDALPAGLDDTGGPIPLTRLRRTGGPHP